MAGGIWFKQNKVRPGAYINFTTRAKAKSLFGEIGVVALPLTLPWGDTTKIIRIEQGMQESEVVAKLGFTIDEDELFLVREALKRAKEVVIARVSTGTKATLTINNFVVEAKYVGSHGNNIQVQTSVNVEDISKSDLKIFVNGFLREKQNAVSTIEELLPSKFVEFFGTGAIPQISSAAGGSLVGGSCEAPTVFDYSQAFEMFESQEFNCIGVCSENVTVKKLMVSFVKRMNEQNGKLVQGVVADYNADYEMISSVDCGVNLKDGAHVSKNSAVAWFAAATAAAGPSGSLTYSQYEGAISPDTIYSPYEVEQKLGEGKIVFVCQKDDDGNEIVVVEQDINTLVSFTKERTKTWRKNRIVRAMTQLGNDVYMFWHRSYIGKVSNNQRGRDLLKADLVANIRQREQQGVFEDKAFDPTTDIHILKGEEKDSVIAHIALEPVDAMEKLYMSVEVV